MRVGEVIPATTLRTAVCAQLLVLVLVPFALLAQGPAEPTPEALSIGMQPAAGAVAADAPGGDIDPATTFVTANSAYDDGDFQRAVELYQALVAHGHGSAAVYYNLGNALLRNGELGPAVAAYRRSQALAPRDQDLRANLSFARRATKDALAPPRPSALAATLFFWHYGLSRLELAAAALLCNLLLWTVLVVRLFRRGSELLRWTFFVVLVLAVAVGGSWAVRHVFPTRVAVVVPAEVDAFTAPDTDAVVRFKLHAGTEVEVRDRRDGWLRIALPDGQQGWLEQAHAEVISY